jgi:two-component system nitrate/nitrite response regulator NarL
MSSRFGTDSSSLPADGGTPGVSALRLNERAISHSTVVRIVLADHQQIFRSGLKWLLESEPGFVVVGEAGSSGQTLRMVRELNPDLLLLDLMLPGGGLNVLKKLAALPLPVRTIALTASIDAGMLVEALQLGARGSILKETTTALLFKSIRSVIEDQYWVSRQDIGGIIEAMRRLNKHTIAEANAKRFKLTRREMDIVAAVAAGESNKGIAERLKLSEDTVKHHVSSVFDKLGVFSRLELAVFALNHKLVSDLDLAS